jgi:hypothetical protein
MGTPSKKKARRDIKKLLAGPPPKVERRSVSGEHHWRSLFTDDEVREMRRKHEADGWSPIAIARALGANRRTIWAILRRQNYRHVK